MKELFEFSFSAINIIPTALLVLVTIYWIIVLFGMIDINSIDIDIDTDVDIDVDADIDLDIDADVDADIDVDVDADMDADMDSDLGSTSGGPSIGLQVLAFFNVGKLPLMILMSFVALALWLSALYTNYYLNITSFGIALMLLIPEFIFSLFVAKIITHPIAKLFSKVEADTGKPEDFRGKTAIVRISLNEDSDGQIELEHRGATVVLHARSTKGEIETGTEVLIIDYYKESKYYIVEPFKI